MIPSRFTLASLATVALSAVAVAGCGNDVPSNGVAKVGDSVIKKSEFDHWLLTAVKGGQQQGGPTSVPDPPDFKKCIAAGRKQPAQGGAKPSTKQLKTQCKTQYDQLKGDVMQFLIQAQWVQQEAKRQDVKVSDSEVQKDFQTQKKTSFPTAKAYQQFLKTSGLTEQDILFRVKLDTLQRKLTQKVTKDEGKITDQDVSDYYAKNKKRFSQPERRDLNVVVTKTKAKADQAKSAIEGGQSFKSVAKKFSIDQASKAQGGKLPDVTKGQQEKALAKAAFAAKTGKLSGPVKTQFGYYVFEVTKVKKASQQSEKQAAGTIRNVLKSSRGQKALNKFIKDFRNRYKGKTKCADDFRVAECDNAPKTSKKTQQQAAPQGGQQVPQQGGQQVPQQGGQQVPQQQAPQGGQQVPQQAPQGGGTQVPQQQTPQPQSP
jgi:foldase protein PrsA